MKPINTKFVINCLWLIITFCFVIETSPAQTISSNQIAYANGSALALNGSGFAANENISLQVMHVDNLPDINVTPWVVTTDANGAFQTTRNIPTNPNEGISDLKVTAHARTSGSWVQLFLDGVTPTLSGSRIVNHGTHAKNTNSAPQPIPNGPLINCSGLPDPGNTLTTSNPICANIEFTLSLQNSGGSGVTYQWQSNTGGGFVDIAGATDATLTTSQSVGTNYQCIVTCTNSGLFAASTSLLVSVANPSGCTLTVTAGGTATQIAQTLLGPGVSVSNATISCTSNAYGTFTGGLANLGLDAGIVLTSGTATDLIGPNSSSSQSTDNLAPGDSELTVLTTSPTFDACSISFDFVPTCDSINFDYVFGSEEYPEFVNSQFNDVFAFFISGPGIIGTQNIALVPGALIPVEINNVNDGFTADCPATLPGPCMNCQYYVNNCEGTTLQYDGYTTALAATSAVTSGQTYHLKIAIADAGDPVYDSGVMLESKSFSCVSTAVVEADAFRGCQDGQVRFCRSGSTADAQTIHYTIGGTAVNGVDYNTIADSIIIPAGQQCTLLDIVATLITTGVTKTVILTTTDLVSLTVNISDGVQVQTSVDVDQQCGFSTLTASGADTYTWSPAEGLSATTGEEVIASPAVATTYTVIGRITESGCADTITVTVNAGPPLFTYYLDADADGYGNANVTILTCLLTPPPGYVSNSTDCNDASASVHPGATEVCGNNIDDNCNGQVDENCTGCPVPTGLEVTNITATSAQLEWNEVDGAEGYKIEYKVAGTGVWTYTFANTHSKTLHNLMPNTKYTWKVKTFCTIDPLFKSTWSSALKFTTSELKAEAQAGVTTAIELEVYPNPFTLSTTISFSLLQDSRVQIELYDLAGRKLQTVLAENVAAGNQVVNLNRDQLSAGIYFIKLSFNGDVMMKKVVIE